MSSGPTGSTTFFTTFVPISYGMKVLFRTSGAATVFGVWQWNDGIGKTVETTFGGSIIPIAASNNLSTAMFGEGGDVNFGTGASGTTTLGFVTGGGNLGWFRINLGGSGGPVTYLAGAYNTTPGGYIHVGTLEGGVSTVPEPAAMGLAGLGLLALGATEIRRRRRKVKPTQAGQ